MGVEPSAPTGKGVAIDETQTPVSTAELRAEFERFFSSCRASLLGQAYLLTGQLQEAEDLAQETLVQAWRNWGRIRAYDDPAAWSRRVLHNFAVNRWKRARLRRRHEQERADHAAAPSIEAHLDLLASLQRLPPNHRRAIVLHDVVGLSAEEIATEMRTQISTVRTWLHRGHRRLKEELGRDR